MRLSRVFVSILTLLAILVALAAPVIADELRVEDLPRVAVKVDGKLLDADAYVVNDRTVVPLRAIFTALNATVEWNAETRTVTGTKGSKVIKLTIDQTEAYVDGKPIPLSVPGMIINGRTFVPLRFIGEALDAKVSFDGESRTVIVETGLACSIPGGQRHEGTIKPGGETWGLCGSPHIVSGAFRVEGADSPILTIEAGVLVQFEKDARIEVGNNNPGGLLVKGTAEKPVVMTSAAAGAKAGDWAGIRFYTKTLRDYASIQNARIEYAGGANPFEAALYAESDKGELTLLLKNVEIKNALATGLWLWGGARLAAEAGIIIITGTEARGAGNGYPVVTDTAGLGSLPATMTLKGNAVNGVYIFNNHSLVVDHDMTMRNLKVPYVVASQFRVEGAQNPTLTIEPGVIMLFPKDGELIVGDRAPGTLVADATAGAAEAWSGNYKSLLEEGAKLANGKSLTSGAEAWAKNKAIVFGSSTASPSKGAWTGIHFQPNAGTGSKLAGVVVNWAGPEYDGDAAIEAEGSGAALQVGLDRSLVLNSLGNGVRLNGSAEFSSFSGNYLTGNVTPLAVFANSAGSVGTGNDYSGNVNEWVELFDGYVTKSQTWQNPGVPYYLRSKVYVSSAAKPVLTIAPGNTLVFAQGAELRVGAETQGTGSLVAVGTADKPITFTSESERPGTWLGINFGEHAGKGNKIEYAKVMYGEDNVYLRADLGLFMKNVTISGASKNGIYRYYYSSDHPGTDYTKESTIRFEGNANDQSK